jgi:hypothetical protein
MKKHTCDILIWMSVTYCEIFQVYVNEKRDAARQNIIMPVIKGKAIPVQVWTGPEGSRMLRFPDFQTTGKWCKVVSPTHRPPLPPGDIPGTNFC